MCIAIYSPASANPLSRENFNAAMRSNRDGMGLAFVGQDGKFRIIKSLTRGDVIYDEYDIAHKAGHDCLLHFRIGTHGSVNEDNCHPFVVSENELMIHNGVIRGVTIPKDQTDSQAFAEQVLRELPEGWETKPGLRKFIEYSLLGSKVVILRRSGGVVILNEQSGHWKDGIWYSNHSYIPYGNSKSVTVWDKESKSWKDVQSRNTSGSASGHYNGKNISDRMSKGKKGKKKKSKHNDEKSYLGRLYDDFWQDAGSRVQSATNGFKFLRPDDGVDYYVYPDMFEYKGGKYCTHCMIDGLVFDAGVEPNWFAHSEDTYVCDGCNVTIDSESPKRQVVDDVDVFWETSVRPHRPNATEQLSL